MRSPPICRDAEAAFDGERLWPLHPADSHGGRCSLFTGDVGAALVAAACLQGDAAFPGLDDHSAQA